MTNALISSDTFLNATQAALRRLIHDREWLLVVTISVLVLAIGLRSPVFLTWRNANDILNDSAILAILVIGQMLV
ncbi:MAG: hypothetical protein ACK422_06895, partial [Burkholderiales bacterium]